MPETKRSALAAMAEIWALSPDVRLGQLMAHLGFLGEIYFDKGLGDIEDDQLTAVLERHRLELLARSTSGGGAASPLLHEIPSSPDPTAPMETRGP